MNKNSVTSEMNGSGDPFYIDKVWVDTIVVLGLTFFILCLMGLSKVKTSKMGMIYGILGMSVIIAAYWADTAYTYEHGVWFVAVSIAPGASLGLWSAYSVAMTTLPEMVGAYNGFGGLAAALTGIGLYLDPNAKYLVRHGHQLIELSDSMLWVQAIALVLSIVIGMMTFTGSMVAVLKLNGTIPSRPRIIPQRLYVSLLLFTGMVVFGALSFSGGQDWNDRELGLSFIIIVSVLAGAYGVVAVMAIGGGDAPVSISFLNSLSGFSTSAAGFMLSNAALVVSGAFVGCSGIILTLIMCDAMNRSVVNVLVGGFGEGSAGQQTTSPERKIEEAKVIAAEDVVKLIMDAQSVIIVPGYGMAVAKAQHSIAELSIRLRRRGIACRFAIHPVAGRMPGHMNVLLAEANVPYDIIYSMDDINEDFSRTDVVLILGGNDIVNPSALTDPHSPISGMPVLKVWNAKHTIVMKRSLRTGYAGVENPLFFFDNNSMYLGDAKASCERLLTLIPDKKSDKPHVCVDIEAEAASPDEVDGFFTRISQLQSEAFLRVGVVKEVHDRESKVAIVPAGVKQLLKSGIKSFVQMSAGTASGFSDKEYEDSGAILLASAKEVFDKADVVVKIREPQVHPDTQIHEINMLAGGKCLISFVGPNTDQGRHLMELAQVQGINLLAVDAIPRISRAQSLDVLSSQAKIAGYRAVLEASNVYQKFLNGEVTSAGTFKPAQVFVIGAGVAGLAAIGTASSLGAIVKAFDTRLETKEQVESMGGKFLEVDFAEDGGDGTGYAKVLSAEFYQKEMELFKKVCRDVSIVITTAAIPGRRAPQLLKRDTVEGMSPGSVIVDLAGSSGGNCELTRPGETYVYNGVTIIGSDMSNQAMAWQASTMYSNNMCNLFKVLVSNRTFELNMEDPIIRGMTCVFENKIIFPPPQSVTSTTAQPRILDLNSAIQPKIGASTRFVSLRLFGVAPVGEFLLIFAVVVFFSIVARYAPISFSQMLGYFILAGFLGYYLIRNVEPALFSPLMSTSNALSGVVILGGILMISAEQGSPTHIVSCIATAVAAINVFGGFAVSYRMLLMFKEEKKTS